MKKIIILLFLLTGIMLSANDEPKKDSLLKKIKKYYSTDETTVSKNLPFIYYINEGGIMIGDLYYNTNFLAKEQIMTNTILYGPQTESFVFLNSTRNIKLSKKWSLDTYLKVMKFEDIHSSAKGNESSVEEISDDDMTALYAYGALPDIAKYYYATGQYQNISIEEKEIADKFSLIQNKLDGYRLYYGWNLGGDINFKYTINNNNNINLAYNYEYLDTQVTTYKSDTLTVWYENKIIDDEINPRKGYRLIGEAMKSLNLLAHDSENDWDYLRLSFDARVYIPVMKKSVLALRFLTESTSGKEVVDAPRTALYQAYSGSRDVSVKTYAPYFNNALLGNLNTFRGFYYNRFFDNHLVLFQSELRIPIEQLKGLQAALFFEAGRVGADYNIDLYTKDFHYCGGIGFRFLFNKDVLTRFDIGFSNETTSVRINEGQTY